MKHSTIYFVCGEICSGKSTIAKQMALEKNLYFLEVSDIVKSLLKTASREELQKSGFLESKIVVEIIIKLAEIQQEGFFKGVVISGVRQKGIIDCLQSLRAKTIYSYDWLWVEVDEEERFQRYMKRADLAKDKLSREAFNEAQKRDNDLGLQEVKKMMTEHEED